MWSRVALCFLVATAYASNSPAWKDNTEYIYTVRGRSLTTLDKLSDQFSGVQIKSKLILSLKPNGALLGRLSELQYAQIHTRLPHGFNQHIPDQELNYQQLPWSNKPFELEMEQGVIRGLRVEKSLSIWEVNMIKSIVSQFQLDVSGKNMIESPISIRGAQNDAVFKTMEDTVSGKSETVYDIHELPEFMIQVQPELVPQRELKNEGDILEVIKTQNYTNSLERPSYHFGLKELSEPELTNNVVEDFLTRASNTRAILTGKLQRFTIQSIFSTEKILVSLSEDQYNSGLVQTSLNISLALVQNQNGQVVELSDPVSVGNLVYSLENLSENRLREKRLSSSDESDESQSNEDPRPRRSLLNNLKLELLRTKKSVDVPLLPNYIRYQESIKENREFDLRQSAEKLVEEIKEDLKDSDKILEESTLSKYTILSSLIRLMSEQELLSLSEQLYSQENKEMWTILRDAVAEAGTEQALLTIQRWIETKKITHSEAGSIVSTMAVSMRTPTEELMRKFFELVRSHNVMAQSGLNETALLSYCYLVNQVYVNKNVSHNQYPVHSFGKFRTQQGKLLLKETIIPYLGQQLEKAIREADTRKIHLYIRALGNVGHKNILTVFEKYLEGKQQISQFQRLMMVVSLDKLSTAYPEVARAALYRIYQNSGELQQIRVAAVYQLIRTNPPKEMLQRMAITSNFDRDQQVNAAVKSVIESLSQLRNPRHEQLRQGAQSAKNLLPKKSYGIQNSMYLKDYVVDQMKQEMLHCIQSLAKPESYLPNVLKYTLGQPLSEMNQQFLTAEYMVSSVKELLNVLNEQTLSYQRQRNERIQQGDENKWSSAKIAELLKLDINQKEQLEGFLYGEMGAYSQMFSFDNRSIERLPEFIREKLESLKNGKHFRITKLGHSQQKALSFPTILGMPFLYTYDVPLLMKVDGNLKFSTTPELIQNNRIALPENLDGECDLNIIISGKVESKISFINPVDRQQHTSGLTRNIQISLPLRVLFKYDIQNKQGKIELATSKFDQRRILHYSTWPYTSRSDILSIQPIANRQHTQIIKKDNQRSFETVLGQQSTGVALKLWGNHPEQSLNLGHLVQVLRTEGPLSAWQKLILGEQMEQSEFNLAVVPEEVETEKIVLRFGHKSQYYTSAQGKQDNLLSQWTQEDLVTNLEKMLQLASSEIESAQVKAYGVAIEFEGQEKKQYSLSLGVGKSNVHPRSNMLLLLRKTNGAEVTQAGLDIKSEIKNTNGLNPLYALEHEPSMKMKYQLFYHPSNQQQQSELTGTIQMQRTEQLKQWLLNQFEYLECKKEMQEGNKQLPACANMTIRANFFDKIEMEMRPQNWNQEVVRAAKEIYQGAQWYYLPSLDIEKQRSQDDVIRMEVKFQPDFDYYNLTLQTAEEKMKVQDLRVHPMVKPWVQIHPVFHLLSRMSGQLLAYDNIKATCVMDKTSLQSWDGLKFPISLNEDWVPIMVYVPKHANSHQQSVSQQLKEQIKNFAILTHQRTDQLREIKMIFNSPETLGKLVQIDLKPRNGEVVVTNDNQEVPLSDSHSTDLYKGYVQMYKLPNQEVKIEFGNIFYLIFDGQTLKITATSDELANSVVGLCGDFDDNLVDELKTPDNCVVRSPQELLESFKLGQQRRSSDSTQCVPLERPLYVNVISGEGIEQYREQLSEQGDLVLRQRYLEEDNQICFTLRPVPVCKNDATETIQREVPVHCVANSKTAALFKKQIERGGNPDFSHKPITKMVKLNIDRQCA